VFPSPLAGEGQGEGNLSHFGSFRGRKANVLFNVSMISPDNGEAFRSIMGIYFRPNSKKVTTFLEFGLKSRDN